MTLEGIAALIRLLGGAAAAVTLILLFAGIIKGMRQKTGQVSGASSGFLHSPLFYFFGSVVFFGICWLLWKPVPFHFETAGQVNALLGGSLLYFGGLALIISGRLALGKYYFVSTGLRAELFEGHRLIKEGPFAIVRHPIYLGILLTGLGGIFLYQTWTFVLVAFMFAGLIARAVREEKALRAEFGDSWDRYSKRVPMLFPRVFPRRREAAPGPRPTAGPKAEAANISVKTIIMLTAAMLIFTCLIGGTAALIGYQNYRSTTATQTASPTDSPPLPPQE